MSEDDEVLHSFIEESREHLGGIIDDLLQIEENGADIDSELVNQVFRTLHSIKGASGFFGLHQVQSLSHVTESILDRFRQKTLVPTSDIVSELIDAADLLTTMINDVEASKSMNISAQMDKLNAIMIDSSETGAGDQVQQPNTQVSNFVVSSENEEISIEEALAIIDAEEKLAKEEAAGVSREADVVEEDATKEGSSKSPSLAVVSTSNSPQPQQQKSERVTAKAKPDTSIRVNIDLLDKLMALAGELVLTRNELIRSADSKDEDLIQSSVQGVNMITSELQEAIMSTRMQTVGIVFNKFKRIVRDLSKKVGKSVNLTISGEDVDMDRTIIEAIGDPLTHLIRNSIDHGIESPEIRASNGKPEQGELHLNAYHAAGQVVIEIIDDGAGINYERVKEKALSNGMMTQEELDRLSQKELARLIFKPGFSTAEKVTDISGRGVGMDVVQRNLSSVGGVVDMDSEPNQGTTISIKLPLTLAIIPSLLVKVQQQQFAIPQVNLVELVRVVPGDQRNNLERIGDANVLRIRGQILPVIHLQQLLAVRSDKQNLPDMNAEELIESINEKPVSIAVVGVGAFKYGIIVDKLMDSAEIVVKPLGKHFAQSREYAGATILGDGSVALILDVAGVKTVMELTEAEDRGGNESVAAAGNCDKQSLLLLANAENELFAIPSYLVNRIEKIAQNDVQKVGNSLAMNRKGKTLQLIEIEKIQGVSLRQETDAFYAIVVTVEGTEVGIMASQVKDIVKVQEEIDDHNYSRLGIMGSFAYLDQIIQLIDIGQLVKIAAPSLFNKKTRGFISSESITILLVEDTEFFLRQIRKTLESQNFKVITAVDGVEGLAALEANPEVDLIVSDIEMPNMNGLEMVRAIRAKSQWSDLPIIAVTSLSGDAAEKAGLAAGFTEYQLKLDPEVLSEACIRLVRPNRKAVA